MTFLGIQALEKERNPTPPFDALEISSSMSLRAMHLNVPRAVRVGHSVTLGCQYDLEGAALYSVKWYRDQVEFYRFVPKEEPPIRVFPIDGIRVDSINRRPMPLE
ncbi:hypothetical protein YQE_04117, partial [Dendroctonus ponderosae]